MYLYLIDYLSNSQNETTIIYLSIYIDCVTIWIRRHKACPVCKKTCKLSDICPITVYKNTCKVADICSNREKYIGSSSSNDINNNINNDNSNNNNNNSNNNSNNNNNHNQSNNNNYNNSNNNNTNNYQSNPFILHPNLKGEWGCKINAVVSDLLTLVENDTTTSSSNINANSKGTIILSPSSPSESSSSSSILIDANQDNNSISTSRSIENGNDTIDKTLNKAIVFSNWIEMTLLVAEALKVNSIPFSLCINKGTYLSMSISISKYIYILSIYL
jgi:hypothetical protein